MDSCGKYDWTKGVCSNGDGSTRETYKGLGVSNFLAFLDSIRSIQEGRRILQEGLYRPI